MRKGALPARGSQEIAKTMTACPAKRGAY